MPAPRQGPYMNDGLITTMSNLSASSNFDWKSQTARSARVLPFEYGCTKTPESNFAQSVSLNTLPAGRSAAG